MTPTGKTHISQKGKENIPFQNQKSYVLKRAPIIWSIQAADRETSELDSWFRTCDYESDLVNLSTILQPWPEPILRSMVLSPDESPLL